MWEINGYPSLEFRGVPEARLAAKGLGLVKYKLQEYSPRFDVVSDQDGVFEILDDGITVAIVFTQSETQAQAVAWTLQSNSNPTGPNSNPTPSNPNANGSTSSSSG